MFSAFGNFIDNNNKRFTLSFAVMLGLHAMLISYMQVSRVMQQEKAKLITNVEIMQISQTPPQAEQPKNVWETIKQAIPIGKGEEGPRPSALDTMKQLLSQATMKPPKLVERSEPLSKMDKIKLDELKHERDQKLNELMDMSGGAKAAKLMQQEQVLKDAGKPMVRPVSSMGIDKAISMEEVGTRKASLSDIAKANTVSRSANSRLASVSQLVENKAELKKQLAALNTIDAGPGLKDREGLSRGGATQLNEVVGSVQERRKAQELITLQQTIEEKEPSQPVHSGGGGFNFGAGGLQNAEALKFNEPGEIQRPAKAMPTEAPVQRPPRNETVAEVKKAPVEISGPLEKRKVKAAYVPQYPLWAKKQGIEADVSLRFFVNPEGSVTQDIAVVITSGYKELDQLCIESLKKWIFVPLDASEPQVDQWGIIKIRFRLE